MDRILAKPPGAHEGRRAAAEQRDDVVLVRAGTGTSKFRISRDDHRSRTDRVPTV
jgi:hypothetical protein